MTILDDILRRTLADVAARERAVPADEMRRRALSAPAPRGFEAALRRAASPEAGRPAIIAEVKKASPSKGVIRADFDPVAIARAYERAGAAAISVLTDEPFFQGRLEYLDAIRKEVPLPLLRKDFILREYQVWEARAAGADAILLILAAVPRDEDLAGLARLASELGLGVLWEVHDRDELRRAVGLGPRILGVNNRSLRTFEVTLETTRSLLPEIPEGVFTVSESGFFRREELERMMGWGVCGFLIGESLLRQADPGRALAALLGSDDAAARRDGGT